MRRVLLLVVCLSPVVSIAMVDAQPPPAAEDRRYSPDEILVMVAEDLATLSFEEADFSRYLTLRGMATKKEREDWARLTVATLHDLSGTRGIYPLITAAEAKRGTLGVVRVNDYLLRINTVRFGDTFARTWERLATQEPYWHGENLEYTDGYELVEYGFWTDKNGKEYTGRQKDEKDFWTTTRTAREKTDKVVKKVRGFFIRTEAGKTAFKTIQTRMVDPRSRIYGTDVPVVDADWFVGQTLEDYKRDPGYHDFLGFDNLKEWQRLAGLVLDPKVIDEQYLLELREAVAHSTVTNEDTVRRILHFDKAAGDVWITQDSNQREADFDPAANALENLGDFPVKYRFQAIEALAHKSNGFVLKGLFDNKGVRQDRAPDFIAKDKTAPYADDRVHTGLCFRCHCAGKSAGFQGIKGWVRNMANDPPNILAVKDAKLRSKLQEQYVTERLEPHLERSRVRFSEALFRATGWKPDEYAEALDSGWRTYVEGPVDVDMAARRWGITKVAFQDLLTAKSLQVEMKANGKTDLEIAEAVFVVTTRQDSMLGAFRPDKTGVSKTLPAVIWQQKYHRAGDVVTGVTRPFSVIERKKE